MMASNWRRILGHSALGVADRVAHIAGTLFLMSVVETEVFAFVGAASILYSWAIAMTSSGAVDFFMRLDLKMYGDKTSIYYTNSTIALIAYAIGSVILFHYVTPDFLDFQFSTLLFFIFPLSIYLPPLKVWWMKTRSGIAVSAAETTASLLSNLSAVISVFLGYTEAALAVRIFVKPAALLTLAIIACRGLVRQITVKQGVLGFGYSRFTFVAISGSFLDSVRNNILLAYGGALFAGSFFQVESLFKNIELAIAKFIRNEYYPQLMTDGQQMKKTKINVLLLMTFFCAAATVVLYKNRFIASNSLTTTAVFAVGASILSRIWAHVRFTEIKAILPIQSFTLRRSLYNIGVFCGMFALLLGHNPFLFAISFWPTIVLELTTNRYFTNASPHN